MANRNINMTEGPLWGRILRFSLPLIASNLLQVFFNLADIAVIGRFGGTGSLGSVGSTSTLIVLFTGFLIGMGSGVNALVAHFYGAKDAEDVNKSVQTSLMVCAALGLFMLVFCLSTAGLSLRLLNTREDLFDKAALYMRIYYLGLPAVAVYNFGNGVYSAVGNTRKPLIFLASAGVLNVILNLIFVIVFNLDVAGVALASIISQYLSAVLITVSLVRCKECYGLAQLKVFDRAMAVRLLKLGIPAGCQNAIFQVANSFIQAAVNSFDSVTVAGNTASMNADPIVYDVMAAFYVACTSFISQNYGAGHKDRMLKSYFICLTYSFVIGMVLGLGIYALGPQFLSIFTDDPEVVEAGMLRLSIMALCYGWSAFMDNSISAARGLGRTFVPTVIVIMGSCVFRIIWVYTVFAYFGTIQSLYLLYIFSWGITAAAEIWYLVRTWKKIAAKM